MTASQAVQRPIPGPWDHVPPAPHAPLHAAVARQIFVRAAARLAIRVELGDGRRIAGAAGGPVMRINRPSEFFRRIGRNGLIGFGEGYVVEDWDAEDLASVLTPFAGHTSTLVPRRLQQLRRWYDARQPASERNDLMGARSNIARHYDLSNDLFELFLDETMAYSSALWVDPADPAELLADAQRRKIDRLLDLARVGPATRVLEIGTGWGELAIRAATRGAAVTTLTLSREQQALAMERARQAGVAERVDVQLTDYREARGSYDAVVSVEMIEAVGAEFWPDYFAAIDRLLAPDGRVALQAITIGHDRLLATRGSYTWIHKYIFPGGILPSVRAISDVLANHTTLRLISRDPYGPHYARTLHSWLERFKANVERVRAIGFDNRFIRMWEFYLAYCEAGFRAGYIDVEQLLLQR